MSKIDAKMVMALRRKTGAPMMDCKAALEEAGGDEGKATEILRKKGLKAADDRSAREAAEGLVFTYLHHNGKLGVLAELGCETDFVARNEEFQQFGRDLCLHVAAMRPLYLDAESVDAAWLANERRVLTEQSQEQMKGRPDDIVAKAVEGRIQKVLAEVCLLEQPWVKDDSMTVGTALKTLAGKIGENISIRRFHRMEVGAAG